MSPVGNTRYFNPGKFNSIDKYVLPKMLPEEVDNLMSSVQLLSAVFNVASVL